ncbi:hypothetical protein THERMOT_1667 [Bathymodiolus thermophilus thioautotrophic gill symbiont]|nr:hypothetical protein THERMOT_1667 [Bathymodiolus thermophilus thioautotrophic gill symbiont]
MLIIHIYAKVLNNHPQVDSKWVLKMVLMLAFYRVDKKIEQMVVSYSTKVEV